MSWKMFRADWRHISARVETRSEDVDELVDVIRIAQPDKWADWTSRWRQNNKAPTQPGRPPFSAKDFTSWVQQNCISSDFAENPLKSVGLITSTFDDALQTLADSPDPGVQKIVQNEKTQNAHFRVPGIFLVRPKVTSHATKVENEWCYCDVYSHLSEHLVDCVDINGDSVNHPGIVAKDPGFHPPVLKNLW